MIAFIVAFGAFLCVMLGALAGMWLGRHLPEHYRDASSHDAIKLATGMLSVLAALVLGLLTASVRDTFDTVYRQVNAFAADIAMLDQTLRDMGPEADAARGLLRQYTERSLRENWPDEHAAGEATSESIGSAFTSVFESLGGIMHHMWMEGSRTNELLNALRLAVIALPAEGQTNQALHDSAIRLSESLVQSRWLLHQRTQSPILPSFVIILTFWISVIFLSFGYNAPWNSAVVAAFFVAAVALAACFFLLVEMDIPFSGMVRIPNHAMRDALDHITR